MENLYLIESHSVSEADFRRAAYIPPFAAEELLDSQNLSDRLQTTLEIEELLEIFAEYAATQVNFASMTFHRTDFKHVVAYSEHSKFAHHFALAIAGRQLGHICYNSLSPLSPLQLEQLARLHRQLIFPLKNSITFLELKQSALKDSLTGLGNRSEFEDNLPRLLAQAQRSGIALHLMVLDLDRFKLINDQEGHLVGDEVLASFAKIIKRSVREADSAFRLGGDEFVVLLFDGDDEVPQTISRRIQDGLLSEKTLRRLKVSTSIGCARFRPADSVRTLFERADRALYQAKANGRNCLKQA
ncbi:GGDEF domain-containing protein [Corallincola luteus]|uniref:diguanylate cyclase n=1 Tax=Corallincola luteus TaxID=1775177 RepID=A0ABY2AJS4_9GAMM|nr:GGDEF domain-containing protein [Corallincola luteus]TCI03023.1 GGDEF domain-containing protein [Corallincola luteus]